MTQLVPQQQSAEITQLESAGQVANIVAAQHIFADYTSRKSLNTLRNQRAGLTLFSSFIKESGVQNVSAEALMHNPQSWRGVTWGLVEGFLRWQLGKGYSIGSINNRLSAVKVYAKLASKAGAISADEYVHIKAVNGYSQKEGKRVDERRDVSRVGRKKAEHVTLTVEQARRLKQQPDTPVGKRDTFLMCLLLDHGLRCGEVARLNVDEFDLQRGELEFYRPKVDKTQIHQLTSDTLRALLAYLPHAPEFGRILRGSRKGGKLTGNMSEQAITLRVQTLGKRAGIWGLSAHDCRHFWATDAARNGTDAFVLRDAGGWSSIAMPSRYVESAEVVNKKVKLSTI